MPLLPGGAIDSTQYQDMRDFSPSPPGKYIAKIVSSEIKPTADTTGTMIILNFEIAAGKYIGKSFVSRLNIVNANPTAARIAHEEWSTIVRAVFGDNRQVDNTDLLHNVAIVATLKLIPGDGKYGPKNEASMYASAQGLTEIPVNPEPDDDTLAIMSGAAPAVLGAPTPAAATPAAATPAAATPAPAPDVPAYTPAPAPAATPGPAPAATPAPNLDPGAPPW